MGDVIPETRDDGGPPGDYKACGGGEAAPRPSGPPDGRAGNAGRPAWGQTCVGHLPRHTGSRPATAGTHSTRSAPSNARIGSRASSGIGAGRRVPTSTRTSVCVAVTISASSGSRRATHS